MGEHFVQRELSHTRVADAISANSVKKTRLDEGPNLSDVTLFLLRDFL